MSNAPLSGIRVLDYTHYIAGPYCTKLFADLGADVIKIEKPGSGDGARWLHPFAGGEPHPEKSLTFLYLNTNKRSIVLDLKTKEGIEKFKELVLESDILVENLRPGVMERLGIDYRTLERLNPRLVMTSISNFGQYGPYRDFVGTELTLSALAGMMYMTGRSDREPVKLALSQLQYTSGVAAAIATLAAYRHSKLTGVGQYIDVSIIEPMLNTFYQQSAMHGYWGTIPRRESPSGFPLFMEAKDGWIHVNVLWFNQLIDFMNIPELDSPKFRDRVERGKHIPEAVDLMKPWFGKRGKFEVFHEAQLQGIPLAPAHDEGDLLGCPQLEARKYLLEVEHPVAGQARYPGRYFVSDEIEGLKLRPAPLLGQHTGEVLGELGKRRASESAYQTVRPCVHTLPLTGIRILSPLHWATVPYAVRFLASLGAEVIGFESPHRPPADPKIRATVDSGGLFNEVVRGSLAISLNLSKPGGVEIFKRLVKISDIVAVNFTPRVMQNFGLDYEALRQVKPDIVYLSLSGFGVKGPWYLYRGYAVSNESASGLVHLTGYIDGPPQRPGGTPFGDMIPSLHAAWSMLVALQHRDRTGKGALLDMSMMEPVICQLGESVLNYSITGKSLGRMGNRNLNTAPSGCYRCRGEDKWIAIAASTEAQWQALVKALGSPAWAHEDRFGNNESRLEHQDDLDRYLEQWTTSRDNMETMKFLQEHGVPAGAVLNIREVMTNEHLLQRGAYEVVQYPPPPKGAGNRLHISPPWKLSRTPARHLPPGAIKLGQDNDYVYRELLKMTDDELSKAEAEGIIGTEATGPGASQPPIRQLFNKGEENHLQILGLQL